MRYTFLHSKTGARRRVSPEWVPSMLKPWTLISLAVFAFAILAALEILRHYTVSQVLSPNNQGILFSARYLPTLVIIALGWIVKGVASDLKKVTPWANMSDKWASSSQSVLLDYISALEIVAVFSALRRKDWAVFLGLLCAFICGALVPLANAVAYVDLFAPRNITTPFTQTSAFQFDNSPLVMPNDSLRIPWNTTGTEPYARAISQRLGGTPRTLWTAGNYAFDQFAVPNATNATATAEVNAVSAALDCQQFGYSRHVPSTNSADYYVANSDDLQAAGCNVPLEFSTSVALAADGYLNTFSWLNITQCSDREDSDLRILASYLAPIRQPGSNKSYDSVSVTGLICSPRFTTQRVNLSVNTTNSEITAFSPLSKPRAIDINTSMEALWIYLRNPLDSDTQEIFGRGQLDGVRGIYDPGTRPVANMPNITSAMVYGMSTRDPFMQVALQGHSEHDPIAPEVFQSKVTDFAGTVWAQVISFLARSSVSDEVPGSIALTEERILLREPILRTCEALLAVVGILAIGLALFRPKTVLEQDPGSLAAASIMLSASDTAAEKEMSSYALSSEKSMTTGLSDAQFTLRQRNAGQPPGVAIDLTQERPREERVETVESNQQTHTEATDQPALDSPDPKSPLLKDTNAHGWRPMPLRLASKISLEVAVVVVMIVLGIMLWLSNTRNGICVNTQVSSAALPLSVSAVLVLFGYCFAGVDASAQAQAPFNVLGKRPNDKTIFTDDLTLLGRLSGLGSGWMNTTLFASAAAYILIIPAMKLVAAGLFSPISTQVVELVNVQLDTSMTTQLENMHLETLSNSAIDTAAIIKQACDFAEWETNPIFGLRPRPGIVGNLVLDNLTAVDDTKNEVLDGLIEARVPAIAVDIQCDPIPSSDFNLSIRRSGYEESITFDWRCATDRCSGLFLSRTILGSTIPRYTGQVDLNSVNQSDGVSASEAVYSILMADMTSLGGSIHSFRNNTPIPWHDDNATLWATPDTLNVTLPTVIAASCRRNLTIVNTNATFTRPSPPAIDTSSKLLPWRPVSVDTESTRYVRQYPDLQPEYFQPPRVEVGMYGQAYNDDLVDGTLSSNTLWPIRGSSRNFFELLAADAHYRVGNLSRLLTPAGLADSATHMYTAYCTQILSELRSYANNASLPSSANQTTPARLLHSQLRVHQDSQTTYVLLALLAVVGLFALLVFCHFPGVAILPKEPGSIASRFSLLANSTLVKQLRQEDVSDVNEIRKWHEPSALGWWQETPLTTSDTPDRSSIKAWRWGVDIGRDALLQSWKNPPPSPSSAPSPTPTIPPSHLSPTPVGSTLSLSRVSTQSPRGSTQLLPELPFQAGGDQLSRTGSHSQRSSVSSLDADGVRDEGRR